MAQQHMIGAPVGSLMEYRNLAWKCVRCGLCRIVNPEKMIHPDWWENCPTGSRYKFETFFAPGRHELVRALTVSNPEVTITDKMRDAVFSCTSCGHCQANCHPIKELQPMNVGLALKRHLVKMGDGPIETHHVIITSILNYDNPWMSPRSTRAKWAKKLKALKIKDASKEKVEVLYFPGCNDSYAPGLIGVAQATARILALGNVDFGILGEKERCCGSTAFRVGALDMFERYKRDNITQLNSLGIKTLVTACAGCYSTFTHEYEGALNFEVLHIAEFIARLLEEGKLSFRRELNMRVTYHDPCHIGRYAGLYDAPRQVLTALPGVEFREMYRIREYSFCCGSGGGVKTAFPELALETARKRIREAMSTGSQLVVSCCPFCELNLTDAANAEPEAPRVVDLLQLVSDVL
jgi:heterodisulfide reductase subunit D